MQNFSNFLISQTLIKPSLFSSKYQIRVADQIWPEKLHFYTALKQLPEIPPKIVKNGYFDWISHRRQNI